MMLKVFLTACLLVPAFSENADVSSNLCNSCIDNFCYTDSLYVKNAFEKLGNMHIIGIPAFDLTENILYYSSERSSEHIKVVQDMSQSFFKSVPGVPFYASKGHTVDQNTGQVYIWTEDKNKENITYIYRYDPVTNTTEKFEEMGEAIKEMHFKEKLYFTLKFWKGIYEYHDGMSNYVLPFYIYNATQFIVDKLEDIYATTDYGVYRLKKGATQVTLFTDKKYSVSVDKDENMYFLDPVLKKVLKLDYASDRIVDAGVIRSNATDRFIFDKHNNIFLKGKDFDTGLGETSWTYIVQTGRCENSSGSLFHFGKTLTLLIFGLFLNKHTLAF